MRNMPPALSRVVERVRHTPVDSNIARAMLSCIDMTLITSSLNSVLVGGMSRDADQGTLGKAASITVHPNNLTNAFNQAGRYNIPVACIVNYPSGNAYPSTIERETRGLVNRGAREIEIVIDHNALRRGDKDAALHQLLACHRGCGGQARMKVVLEGAAFNDFQSLYDAACLAIDCGADMLVTGTMQSEFRPNVSNTSLEHAATILQAIKDNGRKTGLKIGGEVDTVAAHTPYFLLARVMMGADWVRPDNFRIGGRGLHLEALTITRKAQTPPPPRAA